MLTVQDKFNLWFTKYFNSHAEPNGTPPFTYYAESFDKSDYGLAIRIEEGLAIQTQNLELFMIILGAIFFITGVIIIRNQRKLRKELRQLRELLDQKEVTFSGDQEDEQK